jgi:hypothetical protein
MANFLRDTKVMVRFDPIRPDFANYGLCSSATALGGGSLKEAWLSRGGFPGFFWG